MGKVRHNQDMPVLNTKLTGAYTKFLRRFQLFGKVFGITTFLLMCVGIGFIINEWLDTHKFTWQAPIILTVRTPLVIERNMLMLVNPEASNSATPSAIQVEATPKPKAESKGFWFVKKAYATEDDLDVLNRQSQPEILQKVYQKESQSGLHDGCKFDAQGQPTGKVNGFGYGVHTRGRLCFDSLEEVAKAVSDWFEDKINQGYTMGEAFCYYNKGVRMPDCDYYQDILKI